MNKITKIIFLALIILIIILPVYILKQSKDNSFNYNGFKVYKTVNDFYNVEVYLTNDNQPHYLAIRYNPNDLEYIPIEKDLKNKILKDQIYLTIGPELGSTSVIALAEISKVTGNQFLYNILTTGALTYKKGGNIIKTCDDVDYKNSVILLRLANQTQVISKENCVIIEGTNEDEIIKASTKLTLSLLGVMK